jgi:hypothetical protein
MKTCIQYDILRLAATSGGEIVSEPTFSRTISAFIIKQLTQMVLEILVYLPFNLLDVAISLRIFY